MTCTSPALSAGEDQPTLAYSIPSRTTVEGDVGDLHLLIFVWLEGQNTYPLCRNPTSRGHTLHLTSWMCYSTRSGLRTFPKKHGIMRSGRPYVKIDLTIHRYQSECIESLLFGRLCWGNVSIVHCGTKGERTSWLITSIPSVYEP